MTFCRIYSRLHALMLVSLLVHARKRKLGEYTNSRISMSGGLERFWQSCTQFISPNEHFTIGWNYFIYLFFVGLVLAVPPPIFARYLIFWNQLSHLFFSNRTKPVCQIPEDDSQSVPLTVLNNPLNFKG